jgi:hypothetical protein
MNKEEIIRMARETNITDGIELQREIDAVVRFAELIAAAERNFIEQKIHKLDITANTRMYVINHAIRARANNGT